MPKIRPPEGFDAESAADVAGGPIGMAANVTRKGTVRALERVVKRAQAGTGSLEDVKELVKLPGIKHILETGKKLLKKSTGGSPSFTDEELKRGYRRLR